MKKTTITAMILVLSIAICLTGILAAYAVDISTDKEDYAPEETVQITLTDLVPGNTYAVPVITPDSSMVIYHTDGTVDYDSWDNITATETTYVYEYNLDGVLGTYEIRVYNYPWSGDIN